MYIIIYIDTHTPDKLSSKSRFSIFSSPIYLLKTLAIGDDALDLDPRSCGADALGINIPQFMLYFVDYFAVCVVC